MTDPFLWVFFFFEASLLTGQAGVGRSPCAALISGRASPLLLQADFTKQIKPCWHLRKQLWGRAALPRPVPVSAAAGSCAGAICAGNQFAPFASNGYFLLIHIQFEALKLELTCGGGNTERWVPCRWASSNIFSLGSPAVPGRGWERRAAGARQAQHGSWVVARPRLLFSLERRLLSHGLDTTPCGL